MLMMIKNVIIYKLIIYEMNFRFVWLMFKINIIYKGNSYVFFILYFVID